VVAEKKQEIFNLLKTEIAEGNDDETKLLALKIKLIEKKQLFEKNLGKGVIDFTTNDGIKELWNTTFYKKVVPALPTTEKDTLQTLVLDTLKDFQHLDVVKKTWTLFGGKSLDMSDVKKNIGTTDISKVLNATTMNIDTELSGFVKNVRKNNNPFLIQSSKLYTQPDTQREIAIRIALYLYRIYDLAEKGLINSAQATDLTQKIKKEVQEKEIYRFKGIYNVKKELEAVTPEYELLADMNTKLGDINKGNLNYTGAKVDQTYDLKNEFETATTTDYKSYTLQTRDIEPSSLKLVDATGKSDPSYIIKSGDTPAPLTMVLDVAGIPTTIGTFTFMYS
jgi:hypothetical protein